MNGCRHLIRYGLLYCTLQGLPPYSREEGTRMCMPSKLSEWHRSKLRLTSSFVPWHGHIPEESSNAIQSVTFQYSMTVELSSHVHRYIIYTVHRQVFNTAIVSLPLRPFFSPSLPAMPSLSNSPSPYAVIPHGKTRHEQTLRKEPTGLIADSLSTCYAQSFEAFLNFSIDCDTSFFCLASSSCRDVDLVFSYFHHASSHTFL